MRVITFICDVCHHPIKQGAVMFSGAFGVSTEQVEWQACTPVCAVQLLKRGISMFENWSPLTDNSAIARNE